MKPDPEACDDAAQQRARLLSSAERKLNKRILPCVSLLSILCYLDRANLSFASVAMNADLGFSTATYGLGSGLFFIGYALFQVPSNMVIARVGGPQWLAVVAVAWGLVAGCFAAVNSEATFLVMRALLGIAEAGALPGMWWYVSLFYPPPRLTIPMTLVMAGITVAQVIGSPLAAGFLAMHGAGGLAGWRWLFILEAVPAVLLGLSLPFVLPGTVATAAFLTPEEKEALQAELQQHNRTDLQQQRDHHQQQQQQDEWRDDPENPQAGNEKQQQQGQQKQKRQLSEDWVSLRHAVRCRVMWCAGAWRCLYATAVYGLTYFTPLIMQSVLGKCASDVHVVLWSAVPFAAAAIFHLCNAFHSQYSGERRLHIATPWMLGGIFMALLPTMTKSKNAAVAVGVLTLASMGVNGADGPDVSWITTLMTADERLLGLPFLNMLANIGGFVGPYLIGALKTSSGNYYSSEWLMAGCIISASLLVLAFPLRWATAAVQQQAEAAAAAAADAEANPAVGWLTGRGGSSFRAALARGDAMLACPTSVRCQLLPMLEAAPRPRRAATARAARQEQQEGAADGGGMSRAVTY